MLVTIHAPQTIRLADSEFDSTVWSRDHEFLGHPIQTDPPLHHDADPPAHTSLVIDVPDQWSAHLLVDVEVGTPLTVTFTDPWTTAVGLRQPYVVTGSVDGGGCVLLTILQAELQYVTHKQVQQALWRAVHTRPRGETRIVPTRLQFGDRKGRTVEPGIQTETLPKLY